MQNFVAGHNLPEHVEELSEADWKFLKVYVQAMDRVVDAGNYFPILIRGTNYNINIILTFLTHV